MLFANTRRIHEYLCKFYNTNELYLRARISHEQQIKSIVLQLEQLDTPVQYINTLKQDTSMAGTITDYTPLEVDTVENLKKMVDKRLEDMWNSNPSARGGYFKTDSAIMKLLTKHKYTYTYSHHVLRLGVQFMMGNLPFRNWKSGTACNWCKQPYESLDHFDFECYVDINRKSIYQTLENGNDKQIFDLLKSLKNCTVSM